MKPDFDILHGIQHPDESLLEIAIQTVLHKNKNHLSMLTTDGNADLLHKMAQEINHRVVELNAITDSVVGYIDNVECP